MAQAIVGPRYALRAAGEYDAAALAALCARLGADGVEDVCQACFREQQIDRAFRGLA